MKVPHDKQKIQGWEKEKVDQKFHQTLTQFTDEVLDDIEDILGDSCSLCQENVRELIQIERMAERKEVLEQIEKLLPYGVGFVDRFYRLKRQLLGNQEPSKKQWVPDYNT